MELANAILALFVSLAACQTPGLASWSHPPSHPDPRSRIVVTLHVIHAPAGVIDEMEKTYPSGPEKYSQIYSALLSSTGEATELSLQTVNDAPGFAQYSRVLSFVARDQGKPSRKFITVPTSLEATPHINPDGMITVKLKTEMTEVMPADSSARGGAVPPTVSQRVTTMETFDTFGGSDTLLLSGLGSNPQSGKTDTADGRKVPLEFVTVTLLPPVAPDTGNKPPAPGI